MKKLLKTSYTLFVKILLLIVLSLQWVVLFLLGGFFAIFVWLISLLSSSVVFEFFTVDTRWELIKKTTLNTADRI